MKHLLISTALLTATTSAALAENAMFRAEADPMSIQASEFIGKRIYTSSDVEGDTFAGIQGDWKDIGEVNDIVLNRDGSVDSVLVDIGGFLGIGERQVAVGMDALQMVSDSATEDDPSDYFLVMQAEMDDFENAPAYQSAVKQSTENTAEAVDNYADATGKAVSNTAEDVQNGISETASNVGTALNNTAEDISDMASNAANEVEDAMTKDGFVAVQADEISPEMLEGARVYDANDKWMGEVSELVTDDKAMVTHAIVDVGGFLGIGEKPVKLDLNDMHVMSESGGDDVRVYVSMTEDKLKDMPTYEK